MGAQLQRRHVQACTDHTRGHLILRGPGFVGLPPQLRLRADELLKLRLERALLRDDARDLVADALTERGGLARGVGVERADEREALKRAGQRRAHLGGGESRGALLAACQGATRLLGAGRAQRSAACARMARRCVPPRWGYPGPLHHALLTWSASRGVSGSVTSAASAWALGQAGIASLHRCRVSWDTTPMSEANF